MRKFIVKRDYTILNKFYKAGDIVELGQEGFLRYEEVLSPYKAPATAPSVPKEATPASIAEQKASDEAVKQEEELKKSEDEELKDDEL